MFSWYIYLELVKLITKITAVTLFISWSIDWFCEKLC